MRSIDLVRVAALDLPGAGTVAGELDGHVGQEQRGALLVVLGVELQRGAHRAFPGVPQVGQVVGGLDGDQRGAVVAGPAHQVRPRVDQRVEEPERRLEVEVVALPDVPHGLVGVGGVGVAEAVDVEPVVDGVDRDPGPAEDGPQPAELRGQRDAQRRHVLGGVVVRVEHREVVAGVAELLLQPRHEVAVRVRQRHRGQEQRGSSSQRRLPFSAG
jgi:hypothetical protein